MTKVDDLLAYAGAELGKPYVYGDEGPNTFDCSGLMQFVYGEIGIKLPRTAREQQQAVTAVTSPLPGDLVFYGNPAHHVALYVGGGKQIAAPHTGAVVSLQNVSAGATYGRVSGLGTALSSVLSPVGYQLGNLGLTDWLPDVKKIVIEGSVVLAGLALVGMGLWRTVIKPQGSKVVKQIGDVL